MLFRFLKVEPLPNAEWDFDNAEYIGTIDHKDYTEYTKLLHFMKTYHLDHLGILHWLKKMNTTVKVYLTLIMTKKCNTPL